MQSHFQCTGGQEWWQECGEVVKSLCGWLCVSVAGYMDDFGETVRCALCPSCLCCHGNSFISKPAFFYLKDFVNVFVSDLFPRDNRFFIFYFFAKPICSGASQEGQHVERRALKS